MAMNQKSATLPANLRHATTTESKDSGGFFSRLKKRFKLRKGNYDIGVNTGDCENISSVSFRKRESREALTDDLRLSPNPKHKKLSPLGKRPHRSHSDAVSPEKLKIKTTISPKHTSPEHLDNDSKPPKTIDLNNEPKRSSSFKYEVVKANEYSHIHFENDLKTRKPLDLENEGVIKNDCITVDDSAVDLDDDIIAEPGYESLNDVKQRIESKDFSFIGKSDRVANLSDFHSEQVKISQREYNDHVNQCPKTALDDSALSLTLAETNLNNSTSDQLTSSSKSKDSGFESSKTQNSPETLLNNIASTKTEDEIYDEDELRLDPGYAECADAIKGTIPFAAYSDGSGSKLSSCQSLDDTVDDIEPDYAECVDALKSGSVRMRISVSNERLEAQDKTAKTKSSNEHIKTHSCSEVYANPQILFKKRSRNLINDRSSGEFSNRSSETDKNESFTFSSSESLQKDLKEEQSSSQAPPLPARNYSLYLENEEVDELLIDDMNAAANSDDTKSGCVETNKTDFIQVDDNAFEEFGYSSVKETKGDTFVKTLEGSNLGYSSDNDIRAQNKKDNDEMHFSCSVKYTKAKETIDIDNFGGYASVKDTKAANQCEESTLTQRTELSDPIETKFGYATVKDTKGKDFEQFDKHNCAAFQQSNNADSGNFGYATVKEISNKGTEYTVDRKEPFVPDPGQGESLEEEMIDIGYASVKDIKRKDVSDLGDSNVNFPIGSVNSVRETSLEHIDKEVVSDHSNIKDTSLTNRNSFEVKKMKYIKTLEDDFGYSSVSNVKRQSDVLPELKISENPGNKSVAESGSLEQSEHNLDDNFGDFGYSSVKECGKVSSKTAEQTIESKVKDCRSQLILETLNRNFDQIEDETYKGDRDGLENIFPTSPVSEVVSSGFLCSTPMNKDEKDKEYVPVRTSTVVEEDSLEVTVRDRGGSCRVLRITEKEEPTALVEKRKSLRASQKQTCRNSDNENKSENSLHGQSLASVGTCSQQDLKHEQTECKEREKVPKLIISTVSEITDSDSLCPKELHLDQSKITSLPLKDDSGVEGIIEQNSDESVVENANLIENLPDNFSYNCAIVPEPGHTKISYQDSNKIGFDAIKLPVRSNIQKVSYRSVTDSDDSDDSDLKIENLPKLVIDESVFDDSDSSENVNSSKDLNKSEVAEAISNLTEMIEKELNTSEEINEPIHMTLEEAMKEGPTIIRVQSEDNYSNSVSFDINETKESERENVQNFAHTVINEGKSDEQNVALEKESNISLENESDCVRWKEETVDLESRLHLNFDKTSEQDDCLTSVDDSGHLEQNDSTAPPRPPPPVILCSDKSDTSGTHSDSLENKASDEHSDWRNSDSGLSDLRSPDGEASDQNIDHDHLPLIFRPGSGSSQSDMPDDDSPPAIPPRVRIRKHVKEASSCYKDFMESMRQLKDVGWYWGPLIWEEAEAKLANKAEGSFLVRDSSDERYILSLSFKHQGRVHHTRIEHHRGQFSFWSQPESHGKSTIKDFIEQCVDNSRNGRFLYFIRPSAPGAPPLPIHLLHPVSRFAQMRSLQHMCRFAILQMVRRDHIDDLPVPTRIKKYLQEAQYYVEYLED